MSTKQLTQLTDELSASAAALVEAYTAQVKENPAVRFPALNNLIQDAVYRGALESLMYAVGGNQSVAAQIMGINRATLRTKLALQGYREFSQAELRAASKKQQNKEAA